METDLIGTARANDAAIVQALTKASFDGGGYTMVIGIRNESGQIYRRVTAVGMSDFMGCINALLALGLSDEMADVKTMREGCDAIFF